MRKTIDMENRIESESRVKHYWVYLVIVWSIHNLEEALTMSKWIVNHKDKLPFSFFIPIQTILQTLPIALKPLATSIANDTTTLKRYKL
jgi:hypothetical protein